MPLTTNGDRVREGDVVFVGSMVRDLEKAKRFFGEILGWKFAVSNDEWQDTEVVGSWIEHEIVGDQESPTLFLCYGFDDIEQAKTRVADAGGKVWGGPAQEGEVITCGCVDNQGIRFSLCQFLREPDARVPPLGVKHGDLISVTVNVVDPEAAYAFYSRLLGWRFEGDGVLRTASGVSPKVNAFNGPSPSNVAIPLYRVDDLETSVSAVRLAGGQAEVSVDPMWGTVATCCDNQDMQFRLLAVKPTQ